jgi:hypothetical protein
MGRGPTRHPPRHLVPAARSRTDAREHQVAEWLLAAVAVVLTAAVVVSSMFHRPERPEPGPAAPPPSAAPPATGPPGPAPPAGAAGSAGWRAFGGTRVEQTPQAPDERPAAGFTGSGRTDQGMTVATGRRCMLGRTYAATVRLRASRPYALVQVRLLEVDGGRRFAADTVGAVLLDRGWRRVEVAHEAQRPGAALALEVILPRGSPRTTVLVDDLQVAAGRG